MIVTKTSSRNCIAAIDMTQPLNKREAILKAAQSVFVRAGYKGASMEAIAEEAPVSKPTLYSHFGSKHELFLAVIQQQCRSLASSLDRASTLGLPPETGIRTIAESFVHTIYSPGSLALYRLIVAEHHHCPELPDLMEKTVMQPNLGLLAHYLQGLHDSAVLNIPDPQSSGQLLLGMLKGIPHFRCLTGLQTHLSAEEEKNLIDAAVHFFLRGHRRENH
jgi:TetR/AcrR family transcriptional regulator, mexJK operon transcriptional repressor